MKRPGFVEGVAVALVAACAGSLSYAGFMALLPGATAGYVLIAALSFAYLLYVIARSPERTGRIGVVSGWLLIAALLAVWAPSLSFYLAVHLVLVWIVRALYWYRTPLPAMLDLGLIGLGLVAALGAYLQTGNAFATIWCFFLVQALAAFLDRHPNEASKATPEDRFERAHAAAEAAIAKLISQRV